MTLPHHQVVIRWVRSLTHIDGGVLGLVLIDFPDVAERIFTERSQSLERNAPNPRK